MRDNPNYPENICPQTEIMWRPDLTSQRQFPGIVLEAFAQSATLMVFTPTGLEWKYNCLYENDPRLRDAPDAARQATRGVFRLADTEVRLREIHKILRELNGDRPHESRKPPAKGAEKKPE